MAPQLPTFTSNFAFFRLRSAAASPPLPSRFGFTAHLLAFWGFPFWPRSPKSSPFPPCFEAISGCRAPKLPFFLPFWGLLPLFFPFYRYFLLPGPQTSPFSSCFPSFCFPSPPNSSIFSTFWTPEHRTSSFYGILGLLSVQPPPFFHPCGAFLVLQCQSCCSIPPIWGHFPPIWGHFPPIWGHLPPIPPIWGHFPPIWGHLPPIPPIWGHLPPIWGLFPPFGAFCRPQTPHAHILGLCGAVLTPQPLDFGLCPPFLPQKGAFLARRPSLLPVPAQQGWLGA